MSDAIQKIANNLARVRQRIAEAATRSGRSANQIKLVAVTKYVSNEVTAELVRAGCHELGESRPQDLWHKVDALGDSAVRWHLIGHLQRNKVARTVPHIALLHSLDSLRLMHAVHEFALARRQPVHALLEVNISQDPQKHGFAVHELASALADAQALPFLQLDGLMAMAGLDGGTQRARRDFAALRSLRDQLRSATPTGPPLAELSMGMSGDFEVAIEEGATIVRIGSALFEGL